MWFWVLFDHRVVWEKVRKPKDQGRLGIGNLVSKNSALVRKWLWIFPLESDSIWQNVFRSKYGLHQNGWDVLAGRSAILFLSTS